MIDVETLQKRWAGTPLEPWGERLSDQVAAGLSPRRYGDLPRWLKALENLPDLSAATIDMKAAAITVTAAEPFDSAAQAAFADHLRAFHPWRKGPFRLFEVDIDTEWRSDWKWDRLAPHVTALDDRLVLDVGCGNGYHAWRMRGAGAREVIGIDPTPLFVVQFQAVQRYVKDDAVAVLPLGIEAVPEALHAFDTVFSMGVLYHRRSPLGHLQVLRDLLRPGGQLVLETLVIEGDAQRCLVPPGRYARMGNVWFLPSTAMLLTWLHKLGWCDPRVVDETVTSTQEQRSTPWMTFHSLAEFLDPEDPTRTVEGHPAPRRAIILAEAPARR